MSGFGFTDEQIAAAQLRVVLDQKLGRGTPELVLRIAASQATAPYEEQTGPGPWPKPEVPGDHFREAPQQVAERETDAVQGVLQHSTEYVRESSREHPVDVIDKAGAPLAIQTSQEPRIYRVLAAEYLDGIAYRPLREVRELRNEAAQEETDLSFMRRLLHGRIGIVLAEQRRRAVQAPADGTASIVDKLAAILADNAVVPSSGEVRHQPLEPSRADSHRRYVEALVADVDLSDIGALTDEQLTIALTAYRTEEDAVSQRRRQVQAVVDALNSEIGNRYRAGTASVDDLLAHEPLDYE